MGLQVEGKLAHHDEFCGGRRFFFDDDEPELAWGEVQAADVYARKRTHGQGHVDVLADFDFLAWHWFRQGTVELLLAELDFLTRSTSLRGCPAPAP